MRESLVPYGLVRHCPWLLNMLKPMPLLTNQIKKFEKYSDESYDDRIRNKPAEQDIMSHFIKAEPLYPEDPFKQKWLEVGDSKLVVIAGSDTTSSTLTYAMYHLAHDPSHQTMLREELKSANINLGEGFKIQQLQDLKYLNGFIHEVLRLHPALPSGVQRITPPEGLQIGDRFIPGGIDVAIPSWALHRCKLYKEPCSLVTGHETNMVFFPQHLKPTPLQTLFSPPAGLIPPPSPTLCPLIAPFSPSAAPATMVVSAKISRSRNCAPCSRKLC